MPEMYRVRYLYILILITYYSHIVSQQNTGMRGPKTKYSQILSKCDSMACTPSPFPKGLILEAR